MSVEQPNTIDVSGVADSGEIVLTISDHLSWEDEEGHLLKLQDKINTYLAFIEGRQILEEYPDANERNVVIEVLGKYPLSAAGENFYSTVTSIVKEAGFDLRFKLFDG